MTVIPDQTLLNRIRKDDEAALEALFERYYYRLCDFSFQYVKSFDLTEEIVSDVFLSIWERRHTLTIRQDLKAYLFVATRNRSLNHIQRDQLDWETIEENDHLSGNLRPDEEYMFKEVQQQIDLLLNLLPPRRRLIFKLSRMEGFTYQEIADSHREFYHQVRSTWEEAPSPVHDAPYLYDYPNGLNRLRQKMARTEQTRVVRRHRQIARRNRRIRRTVLSIAAILLLAVMSSITYVTYQTYTEQMQLEEVHKTIAMALNVTFEEMEDGSVHWGL